MVLPPAVARFNRLVTNRLTRPFAGRLPWFAILTHQGRRSGRTYRIPINAFRDGNDYLIALTYGPNTDWVRNVLAAGGCEILTRGHQIRLSHPRIITDPRLGWTPVPVRLVLGLIGATEYMRLTCVPTSPAAGAGDAPTDSARVTAG